MERWNSRNLYIPWTSYTDMNTRFLQLDIQTFNGRIPGTLPTILDQGKFFNPEITDESMSERAIGIELVSRAPVN